MAEKTSKRAQYRYEKDFDKYVRLKPRFPVGGYAFVESPPLMASAGELMTYKDICSFSPPHKIIPGYRYCTGVRKCQPAFYPGHCIAQPTDLYDQTNKTKNGNHIRLEDGH